MNRKSELCKIGRNLVEAVDLYIEKIEENNMTNEQFFLDVLDKLNKYSVKY